MKWFNKQYPYQTIDSGLFYKKVIDKFEKESKHSIFKGYKSIKY